MVLDKTLENLLDCKEIKLVNPKGNQPWKFIGKTDAEAEASILWSTDVKCQLIGEDPNVAQTVKNSPTMQESWVQSLGWEDPLEEGMTTHSSVLAWRITMDWGAWLVTVHGVAKSQTPLSD